LCWFSNQAEIAQTLNVADAFDPDVAMDPNGDAVVLWSESDGVRVNLWSKRFE
jgi:hypothetical protein